MILYSELVAWLVRASIFSFWFTGLFVTVLFDANSKGMIKGFDQKYILLIVCGIIANIAIYGLPQLRMKKHNNNNMRLLGEFKANTFETIIFLLQGTKVKNVIRNLSSLSGIKQVFMTRDKNELFITNSSPRKSDSILAIIHACVSFMFLLLSPALMVMAFMIIKYIFARLNIASDEVAGGFVQALTITILANYTSPYLIQSKRYLAKNVRYIYQPLGKHFGYPVFSSPLLTFLTPNHVHLGFADENGSIYVNTDFIEDNNEVFDYVIAHEAGHLADKVMSTVRTIMNPILFPGVVFIVYVFGNYMGNNIIKNIAFVMIAVVIATSLYFQRISEFRADDYAVKTLGINKVKNALHQINLKVKTVDTDTVPSSKRLERIIRKWGS